MNQQKTKDVLLNQQNILRFLIDQNQKNIRAGILKDNRLQCSCLKEQLREAVLSSYPHMKRDQSDETIRHQGIADVP